MLPLAGLFWHINDQWDLQAYLPEPKLVYHASDVVDLWVGGGITGGAFQSDARTGDGAKISHTPVEYYEVRAGAGLDYLGWKLMTVHVDLGYAFVRKFDYFRADLTQATKGAPYLSLSGEMNF